MKPVICETCLHPFTTYHDHQWEVDSSYVRDAAYDVATWVMEHFRGEDTGDPEWEDEQLDVVCPQVEEIIEACFAVAAQHRDQERIRQRILAAAVHR